MRRIVVLSLSTVLLTLGCGPGAPKPEAKADTKDDAKVAPPALSPEAKADTKGEAKDEGEGFGEELCSTIIPCFQTFKFTGNFSADVSADIEPDGSVSAVSFTGKAPKPVQACITGAIGRSRIEQYNGEPGRVRCQKSGQLMAGGGQMVMSDRSYELRDAAGAPVDAKADAPADAKAADAKAADAKAADAKAADDAKADDAKAG